MKSVALHNLGCKVNGYEMDAMQQMLQERGYKIVPFDEEADIYIVNTCTVTNIADRKSRQMLHKAKKRNPEATVVAVGCYVQAGSEEALKDSGADLAIGNNKKKDLAEILEKFLEKKETGKTVIDIGKTDEFEEMHLKKTSGHTRAYIKIQDGCNQFCSYCIIPYVRGRVRSRREEDILREVRELAAGGCKEAVLTGIHISSYGTDRGKKELASLVRAIHDIDGIKRIRLSSLEPGIITEDFAEELGKLPKLCPHFHLSLQSGCDATLKRMNRHYTTGEYFEKVEILRRIFGNPAVTTDVIVGFPGETEAEFAETKAERSSLLLSMGKTYSRQFREGFLGQELEVLFEEEKNIGGTLFQLGHTRQYVKVAKMSEKSLSNEIFAGKITGFLSDDIMLLE